MEKVLISACLLGVNCRYDGGNCRVSIPNDWALVPFCPEMAGGLGVPRYPAEITGGDGNDVLAGRARVINSLGKDVTEEYIAGAQAALAICRKEGVTRAILKSRSPSCGLSQIYDGSHQNVLRPGPGVCAALLGQHGIKVESM